MAEEKDQTGASWEDRPLPDEYPEPHMEDTAELNGEAGEDASAATEESAKDQSVKCSPNLLLMLKAAESRWTPQGRDSDGAEASETAELVAEALKTDMVSEDTAALPDLLINTLYISPASVSVLLQEA